MDAPIGVFKGTDQLLPVASWRGQFDGGTCPSAVCGSAYFFPGSDATAYGDANVLPNGPPSWYGDLLTQATDASGLQYKRNRYYDPTVGRFTQEDPIGLAGGLNLYGYANGDPVNFSDPFGLFPCCVSYPQGAHITQHGVFGAIASGIREAWVRGIFRAAVENEVVGVVGGIMGLAASGGIAAATDDVAMPSIIYRRGTPSPSNLRLRPGEGALSFRSSISNPVGGPAVLGGAGDDFFGIATSKLRPGSVVVDNLPPGHVSVRGVSVEALKDAVVERGRFPKQE